MGPQVPHPSLSADCVVVRPLFLASIVYLEIVILFSPLVQLSFPMTYSSYAALAFGDILQPHPTVKVHAHGIKTINFPRVNYQ